MARWRTKKETISGSAERPTREVRAAFKRRRCLIPADGFYEWKKVGAKKQPYHITLPDQKVFAFAGL